MTGNVITVNQSQYNMVRGKTSNAINIEIASGRETLKGDVYIIPFIAENHYFSGQGFSTYGNWKFWLGEITEEDTILFDYPIKDISNNQVGTLWNVSKIFEAANCIWFDPSYIGEPLVSNEYNYFDLFSNGFSSFGGLPESIELARLGGGTIKAEQFGLIDLSQLDLNIINNMSANTFKSTYGHLITSRATLISEPKITGPSGNAGDSINEKSINENTTAIHTFTANEPIIWSLNGGADASKFSINSISGALIFNSTPNYESPSDSDSSNDYVVIIKATDSAGNTSDQTITVLIDNINETATALTLSSTSFNENIDTSSSVATLSTTDPDSSDTHTYSLVNGTGDTDNSSFTIDGSSLTITSSPDYETKSSYNIRLKTTDSSGESFSKAFTLSVNDLVEKQAVVVATETNGLTKGAKYTLNGIKDYDGNLHGYLREVTGEAPTTVKSAYKYQGTLDVNNDGTKEAVYTNQLSGRWVTASIDPITGAFDYSKHGAGETTRIVGIYQDPLVTAGLVEKDSPHDGSRTFSNDLKLDNLILKTVGDYDGDGFQEVYWSKVDNTAYLRAVMHADGNIQYANYQNLTQMTDYLTSHGFADTVALIA